MTRRIERSAGVTPTGDQPISYNGAGQADICSRGYMYKMVRVVREHAAVEIVTETMRARMASGESLEALGEALVLREM